MIEFHLRLRCKAHPGYCGARAPHPGCKDCEAIHLARHDPGAFLRMMFGRSVYVEMEGKWKHAKPSSTELPPDV